jgi:diguanylate cyclase (GGDEF)-like protein
MPDSDRAPHEGQTPAVSGNGSSPLPGDGTSDLSPHATSSDPNSVQPPPTAARPTWFRPSVGLAVLCLLVGTFASVLGAHSIAHSNATQARDSFRQASAGVTSTVKLALQHEEEVLSGAGTYFAANPITTRKEFAAWTRWARTLRNHPDLQSLGLLTLVHTPELSEFEARLAKSDGRPGEAHLKVGPRPSGAFHCLAVTTLSRGPAVSPRPGRDYCERNPQLLSTRDTSFSSYTPVSVARQPALEVQTPVYRGGPAPEGLAGRRGAFVGWLRELVTPGVLLAQALHGDSALSAQLRHTTHSTNVAFTSGTHQSAAQRSTSDLPHGWSLVSFGPSVSSGVLSDHEALTLLIGGLIGSILFALLVLSLGREADPLAAVSARESREDLYDALTGLPNRGLTLDRAERMLARAGRQSGVMVGALFIDIDWFKELNEKLGQERGDELLKIVAGRLENVLRAHDTVGRYGGDEFVLLVESAAQGMRLDSLARRVIEALHKPVEIDGFDSSFCITASIGVAFGRYATPQDLLRDAHMALLAAKAAGRDRYTLFNANMRSVIEGRGVLEVDLNAALQAGQFSLLYQPIRDLSTNRPVALEALIRWQHPIKGEVAPADFIPLAEECGLIVPIGRWVLEEACTRVAALNVAGYPVAAAVKISPHQLNRDGFITDVLRALQQSGLEPSRLVLEIAETTVMADADLAARRLAEIKQLGVRLAIDDFGSGYAYRSDLQRMPIDFLKVDRSSLASSEDEDYRSWLLEAILVFGRDLALTVIAKGIENQEQLSALQGMGCTMAQGFFVGEPAPGESLESLFVEPVHVPAVGDGFGHSR